MARWNFYKGSSMTIKNSFANALKTARLAKKFTQEDFSEVSSRTYISTLERGLYSPTLEKVDAIAKVINIHPLTLLMMTYLEDNQNIQSTDDLFKTVISELKEISNY